MTYTRAIFVFILLLLSNVVNTGTAGRTTSYQHAMAIDTMTTTLNIRVGKQIFPAKLLDNPSVNALKKMLPLTLNMTELNGNEKYFRLSEKLPIDAIDPNTIEAGDIMLWGNQTLVLFYESFSTSYSYTRLGKVNNPGGLAAALGKGNVTVTFELAE